MSKIAIVIHGGAGNINLAEFSDERQKPYKDALHQALQIGLAVLQGGGESIAAVAAAVKALEDCPLFNAGKGAVLNADGKFEMDAAVMCGKTKRAGAVAGISGVKNPIYLALGVMNTTAHVLLIGKGAEELAKRTGVELVDDDYFKEELRFQQWQKAKAKAVSVLDHSALRDEKFGTVGAVALDKFGNLAAATSTGGMTNKMPGRVGDSPLIGSGTYANNATCAVSCTGHGEHFIKHVAAYDLSCLMEYKGLSLKAAGEYLIHAKLKAQNADGGLIALDAQGNVIMPFNTTYMFYASSVMSL